MTVENLQRFDVAALKRLAGGAFARGEAYHREGRVDLLAIEPRRVLARVSGTEDYRVNLLGAGETIKGECDCPAFDDYGFCKHMVATALAANATGHGEQSSGVLARIRAHLEDKSNGVLVAMIVELAERDPALFRKLEIASAADRADDKTLAARLGKAIDQATATRGFVEYGEAGGWAAASTKRSTPSRLWTCGMTGLSSSWPSARSMESRPRSSRSTIRTANAAPCSSARATSTSARPVAPSQIRSRSPATSSSARPQTATERSTARPGFTPTCSARPDWRNIAGSRPKRGKSCRRSAAVIGAKAKATIAGYRKFSIASPSATATSRRASRCAPRTCRRRGSTLSSPSSASSTKARTRRCAGPRKAYGRSRMALPTRASCSSPPTFL